MKVDLKWLNDKGLYNCPFCEKEFTLKGISTHIFRKHKEQLGIIDTPIVYKKYIKVSNKEICEDCGRNIEITMMNYHKKFCSKRLLKTFYCKRCNIEHDGSYGSGKYCSLHCANSRIISDDTKIKTSKTLIRNFTNGIKEKYEIIVSICPNCNKNFNKSENENKVFCSTICSRENALNKAHLYLRNNRQEVSSKISKTRKLKFLKGELNVTGGTSKWYDYKNIKVQGSHELRMCYILDEKVKNK